MAVSENQANACRINDVEGTDLIIPVDEDFRLPMALIIMEATDEVMKTGKRDYGKTTV